MKSQERPDPGRLSTEEIHALEVRWYEGQMLPIVNRLLEFVAKHRDDILATAGTAREPAALVNATRQYITHRGSMHMASEVSDQIREIQNELWYRGERGDHDSNRIKNEWTAQHASAWRRWRIQEYLFVAEKCGEEVTTTLLGKSAG